MKFTVERKTLVKMLKLLSLGGVVPDAHLRISAQGGRISLTVEDVAGTSFEADVAEEGVCFFRHKQFLPLLRSYRGTNSLTVVKGSVPVPRHHYSSAGTDRFTFTSLITSLVQIRA